MSDELRPCPFCGGRADTAESGEEHEAFCLRCGAEVTPQPSASLVRSNWNHRPVEDELRAENQRLREALEPLAKAADEHDAEKLRNGYVYDYDYSPDGEPLTVHGSGSLTVGDARRARAALEETKR